MHMKFSQPFELPQPKNRADAAAEREARCRADVLRVAFAIASARSDSPAVDGRKVPRAELLRRLPHWTHTAIAKALKRLEAEGLLFSSEFRTPAHKAWAFQVAPDGVAIAKTLTPDLTARLDMLMARLLRRPDRIDAALSAISTDAVGEGEG